ncbi:MAG: DUF835 domain-containing protein [Methanomassiliicoccales archaeon]|nr:DUF835 domain-containing protein [Methanomassiliicoccales archaeon]
MSEEESYAKGYMKGYEEGLKEAWEELISMTSKGYTSREIQILAKTRKSQLQDKVDLRQKRLKRELDLSEEKIVEIPSPQTRSALSIPVIEAAPIPEQEGAQPLNVVAGATYIIKDKRLDQPMAALKSQLKKGASGLCIVRTPPAHLREKYALDCRMVWLTKMEGMRNGAASSNLEIVSPTDTPAITSLIKSFISENKKAVVLLEGLEYLINQNDFKTVLKFLSGTKDQVFLAKGILLVPFDPVVLEPKDLKALERESDEE